MLPNSNDNVHLKYSYHHLEPKISRGTPTLNKASEFAIQWQKKHLKYASLIFYLRKKWTLTKDITLLQNDTSFTPLIEEDEEQIYY